MKEVAAFLQEIGLSQAESDVWLALRQMGTSPASSIARQAHKGRVTTYKILQRLLQEGLVSQTKQGGTTHFWIPDSGMVQSYIERQQSRRTRGQSEFVQLKSSIDQMRAGSVVQTPTIQLYEGRSQVAQLFYDIQKTISDHDLRSIVTFGTATFQEQVVSHDTVADYAQDLLDFLDHKKLLIHNHIAEGGLTMEYMRSYLGAERFGELPAGDHAINLIIAGQTVYVVIYSQHPIGIQIGSPELARALHFVLQERGGC